VKREAEHLGTELLFFVVRGQKGLAVVVEAVYEAENGVGRRTHRREDSGSV
jgi:hypothetical protein